jgi:hypothetical protein
MSTKAAPCSVAIAASAGVSKPGGVDHHVDAAERGAIDGGAGLVQVHHLVGASRVATSDRAVVAAGAQL